jgi:hypothetical protein
MQRLTCICDDPCSYAPWEMISVIGCAALGVDSRSKHEEQQTLNERMRRTHAAVGEGRLCTGMQCNAVSGLVL